ncbi:MAG: hypothetical protein FWH57_04475 [Oscillospiraceae bacterium]|nr:hypothetical protein [Oscillospiraceae bacterium]
MTKRDSFVVELDPGVVESRRYADKYSGFMEYRMTDGLYRALAFLN